jgi:tetratricopeptide (TPR) repeat protein
MKKLAYLVAFFALAGCSSGGKFGNLTSDNLSVEPRVLELKGGEVPVAVAGTFPRNFFPKDGVLEFTPVLVTSNGKTIKGNKVTLYGENVKNPGAVVVSHSSGGRFSDVQSFKFTDDMKMSELYADFNVKKGNKNINFSRVKLADGVITTPMLVDLSEAVMMSSESLGMAGASTTSGTIQYIIQQANIRSSEVNKAEIRNLLTQLKNSKENTSGAYIQITSAASPDGNEGLNSHLAQTRDDEATRFINAELRKLNMNIPVRHNIIQEDWDGLYKNIQASNLNNKDQIVRILKAEPDPQKRQVVLQQYINQNRLFETALLPPLRRSEISFHAAGGQMTEANAKALMEKDPYKLSLNDRLSVTSQMTDNKKKVEAYRQIIRDYPNDWRAYNNLASLYIQDRNWRDASPLIDQSVKLQNIPENNYNMGLVQFAQGNYNNAQAMFTNMPSSSQWDNARGAVEILRGNYANAVAIYGNEISNNAALAQIMNKNYTTASSTLNRISNPNATTYYLRAILGARTNDRNMVINNLSQAKAMDRTLVMSAKNDIEFARYMNDSQFKNLIK